MSFSVDSVDFRPKKIYKCNFLVSAFNKLQLLIPIETNSSSYTQCSCCCLFIS